ncbi:class I SAM-dependent methyltransferase [Dermabacteraceae bacterium P13095]
MLHPPIPPVSNREHPALSSERRVLLAAAYSGQGPEYERLRPGYPAEFVTELARIAGPLGAVDVGAGTGKLAAALSAHGVAVTAVDPSEKMLAQVPAGITALTGGAEALPLPGRSVSLYTAAQAWHWFDTAAACREADRVLADGGTLALLWNTLDVTVPWVHRLSRIMHAGDILKDGFVPPMNAPFCLSERREVRWEQRMSTADVTRLAATRSYWQRSDEKTRRRVAANLDWYLYEHLGHAPDSEIALPYRSDLLLYRR